MEKKLLELYEELVNHLSKWIRNGKTMNFGQWHIKRNNLESQIAELKAKMEKDEIHTDFYDIKKDTEKLLRQSELAMEQKIFDIDICGHTKIQISVEDNVPTVIQAMNGYGEREDVSTITIFKI